MGQPSKEVKDKWLADNKHKRPQINKACRLRTFYGISVKEFQNMLEQQGGKCAICDIPFGDDKKVVPHVDHDHDSGWVRGLTCQNCNLGIGHLGDDIIRMQKAIDYLILHATPPEFNINAAREHSKFRTRWDNVERVDEYKDTMRKKAVGNTRREGIPAWNKGQPWSPETRQKMSAAAKRRVRKTNAKF